MTISAPIAESYCLPLASAHAARDRAGSKAANLGQLAAAGFPVPDGFVVATEAFARFLAFNELGEGATQDAVAGAPLPPEVASALLDRAAGLGDVVLAVRSSGVAEDLAGASYAGQYETVLGVRGEPALVEAVRRCWASAFNARVTAYRAAQGQAGVPPIAVLVQRQVAAAAAGVAFTANPVSGDRGETLVSAVRGLGERLVSGEVSPDEWSVRGDEAVCLAAPEDAIDGAQARAIAALARRVEAHFGGAPQDVEWAVTAGARGGADGELFLLQARPITTLAAPDVEPLPVPVEPPEGFWQREATHYPDPLSPMHASVWLPIIRAATREVFAEGGLLVEEMSQAEIGGWIYQRLRPLGGKDRKPPPRWLAPLLFRLIPRLRERSRTAARFLRTDRPAQYMDLWEQEWMAAAAARIGELGATDPTALGDLALDAHVEATRAFLADGATKHFKVHLPDQFLPAELAFFCEDHLGWDCAATMELLVGTSTKSSEPSRRLAALAAMVADRPATRELLQRVDASTVGRLRDVDPAFAAAFEAYRHEYGRRALHMDVREPTLAECPEVLLGLVRDQLVRGYDADAVARDGAVQREAVTARARDALAGRPAERAEFERLLARARRAYPLREENEFYLVSAPLALLRLALLEVGRRLVERGQVAAAEDAFFLRYDEVRAALRDGQDRRPLVRRRQGERAWVLAHPGPRSYGQQLGPPPSLDALPPDLRFLMRVVVWAFAHMLESQRSGRRQDASATALDGIAASAGRYTGPARIVRSESDFGKIRAGDVLVCPITSPVWSVVFPSIGALVTDNGGVLSHSAIIAREYRIPAVLATGNATGLLRDDQIVTVDGGTGLVEILAVG